MRRRSSEWPSPRVHTSRADRVGPTVLGHREDDLMSGTGQVAFIQYVGGLYRSRRPADGHAVASSPNSGGYGGRVLGTWTPSRDRGPKSQGVRERGSTPPATFSQYFTSPHLVHRLARTPKPDSGRSRFADVNHACFLQQRGDPNRPWRASHNPSGSHRGSPGRARSRSCRRSASILVLPGTARSPRGVPNSDPSTTAPSREGPPSPWI
jgi:hypothetical protein